MSVEINFISSVFRSIRRWPGALRTFFFCRLNISSAARPSFKQRRFAFKGLVGPGLAPALVVSVLTCSSATDTHFHFPSPDCQLANSALMGFETDNLANLRAEERLNAEYLLEVLRDTREVPRRFHVLRSEFEDELRKLLAGFSLFFPREVCPEGCTAYAVRTERGKRVVVEFYYRARVIIQPPAIDDSTEDRRRVEGALIFMDKDRRHLVVFSNPAESGLESPAILSPGSHGLHSWSKYYFACLLNLPGQGDFWSGSDTPLK